MTVKTQNVQDLCFLFLHISTMFVAALSILVKDQFKLV